MDNNEKEICRICGETFNSDAELHRHLRTHKFTIANYYHKYYPRYDKFSGILIEFKNKEQYLNSEFISKNSFTEWFLLKSTDQEKIDYIKSFLSKRKVSKNIKWVPTQVELRSLICPAISTIEKYFDYYKYCESELGLSSRFFESQPNITKNQTLIVDTREQSPLDLGEDIIIQGLKYGDYKANKETEMNDCVIERKSFSDFVSTLSNGLERFKNELDKAKKDGVYIVVLIEENLTKCVNFKPKLDVSNKSRVTPEFIFKNVRDLIQSDNKIQFLFVNNRLQAARIVKKLLLESDRIYTSKDLQLLYDKKLL